MRTAGEKAASSTILRHRYSAVGRLDEPNLERELQSRWDIIWLEPATTPTGSRHQEMVLHGGHAHSCETIYGYNMSAKGRPPPTYVQAMAFTNSPDITIPPPGVVDGYQDWSTSGYRAP